MGYFGNNFALLFCNRNTYIRLFFGNFSDTSQLELISVFDSIPVVEKYGKIVTLSACACHLAISRVEDLGEEQAMRAIKKQSEKSIHGLRGMWGFKYRKKEWKLKYWFCHHRKFQTTCNLYHLNSIY